MISEEDLTMLACPVCKGELVQTCDKDSLLCRACALCYKVKAGIPILLAGKGEKTVDSRPEATEL